MLKALILENFKAFGGRRVIPIKPITLIFGPNSAGKSAILQSLLMLKQTVMDQDVNSLDFLRRSSSPVNPTGSLVDLGSFRDLVYLHDTDRDCEITPLLGHDMRFPGEGGHEWTYFGTDTIQHFFGTGIRFGHPVGSSTGPTAFRSIPIYADDTSIPVASVVGEQGPQNLCTVKLHPEHRLWENLFRSEIARRLPDFIAGLRADEKIWSVADHFEGYNHAQFCRDLESITPYAYLERDKFRLLTSPRHPDDDDGQSTERKLVANALHGLVIDVPAINDFTQLNLWAEHSASYLSMFLRDLDHIGPIRAGPQRYYTRAGSDARSVSTIGQASAEVLLRKPGLVTQINKAFDKFGIHYRTSVEQLRYEDASLSEVFVLRFRDTKTGAEVSIKDVGFGFSQVLPVLLQCFVVRRSTTLIEQPELHLHPRLQAELADVFLMSARTREHSGLLANTFVIETHSEHLILRLMRRMRETSQETLPEGIPPVRPEDVSIIYVQPTEDGSVPIPIELDEDGELLTAWPNGFFEEGFRERFA